MKTAIIYYSKHHGNTKKLLDAICEEFTDIDLIDVTDTDVTDLSGYDRIGIASGIYFSDFAKQIKEYAKKHLPVGTQVFLISTQGAPMGRYFGGIMKWKQRKGFLFPVRSPGRCVLPISNAACWCHICRWRTVINSWC